MPRARKTAEVDAIRFGANKMLEQSIDSFVGQREGIAALLERILMDTNNYKGFMFSDGERGAKDESRRYYY